MTSLCSGFRSLRLPRRLPRRTCASASPPSRRRWTRTTTTCRPTTRCSPTSSRAWSARTSASAWRPTSPSRGRRSTPPPGSSSCASNVRFHDGTPFTADDVIFSFERAPNVEGSPSSFGIYTRGKTLHQGRRPHRPHQDRGALPADAERPLARSSSSRASTARARRRRTTTRARPRSAPGRTASSSTRRATASSCSATTSTGARSRPGSA